MKTVYNHLFEFTLLKAKVNSQSVFPLFLRGGWIFIMGLTVLISCDSNKNSVDPKNEASLFDVNIERKINFTPTKLDNITFSTPVVYVNDSIKYIITLTSNIGLKKITIISKNPIGEQTVLTTIDNFLDNKKHIFKWSYFIASTATGIFKINAEDSKGSTKIYSLDSLKFPTFESKGLKLGCEMGSLTEKGLFSSRLVIDCKVDDNIKSIYFTPNSYNDYPEHLLINTTSRETLDSTNFNHGWYGFAHFVKLNEDYNTLTPSKIILKIDENIQKATTRIEGAKNGDMYGFKKSLILHI